MDHHHHHLIAATECFLKNHATNPRQDCRDDGTEELGHGLQNRQSGFDRVRLRVQNSESGKEVSPKCGAIHIFYHVRYKLFGKLEFSVSLKLLAMIFF
jgi:hypothetical protein